jgi:hypothetical protein
MAVTMQEVIDALTRFEPDYSEVEEFGSEALPHLEILVKTAEPLLASKAVSMASMIEDTRSINILMIAARSKFRQVRVAAAYGSRNLRIPEVNKVLNNLKDDQDENIRNISRKSIELRREYMKEDNG